MDGQNLNYSDSSFPAQENPAPISLPSHSAPVGNLGIFKLSSDLRAIAMAAESREQFTTLALDAAVRQSPLLCALWLESPNGDELSIVESQFTNQSLDIAQIRDQILKSGQAAIQTQQFQIAACPKIRAAAVICVPFLIDGQTTAVISGLIHDCAQNSNDGLLACQMVNTHYDLWRARDELTTLAFEVRSTATVLELVAKAQNSRSVRQACYRIANELKDYFRCEYVAVGLRSEKKRGCKLIAISSLSEFDSESQTTLNFRSAFDEASLRGTYTVYPPRTAEQRNASLGHKKLANHLRCESAISITLRNQEDEIVGVVTIVGNRTLDRNPATRNFIDALEHPLGSSVDIVRYAEGGPLRRAGRFLFSGQKTNLLWAGWAVALVALIAMFVSVPYKVHCVCQAEPVVRRIAVAPYEGLLENTFVEPGDLVTQGQRLARMDGREVRFERAGVEFDKSRAIKKRDTHRANKEIPDALMADLEWAQLEQKSQLLDYREQNFEIVSPINGIVLSGSIDRRENYPVSLGQALFEIAPLHPLRVELAVRADEIMHVKEGQPVKIRFDGFGTQTVDGIIHRIRPSTTIRDDKNVFIAEALLDNQDGSVRPGMEGRARIFGEKRRIGWILFHRPWERLVTALGF